MSENKDFNHFYLVPKGTEMYKEYMNTEDHNDTPFTTFMRIFNGLWGFYEFKVVEEDLLLACQNKYKKDFLVEVTEADYFNEI